MKIFQTAVLIFSTICLVLCMYYGWRERMNLEIYWGILAIMNYITFCLSVLVDTRR